MTGLLEVRDLTVRLAMDDGPREVLTGISLDIAEGEAMGLVGESGSGKSMTAKAIARLLPRGAETSGLVSFAGTDVLALSGDIHLGSQPGQFFVQSDARRIDRVGVRTGAVTRPGPFRASGNSAAWGVRRRPRHLGPAPAADRPDGGSPERARSEDHVAGMVLPDARCLDGPVTQSSIVGTSISVGDAVICFDGSNESAH